MLSIVSGSQCFIFSSCPCVSGGSCSITNSGWTSVAVSSVVKSQSTSSQVSTYSPELKTAVASGVTNQGQFGNNPLALESNRTTCSDSYKDLFKTFQSKCTMQMTVTYARFIALIAFAAMIGLSILVFGAAYALDRMEISKLAQATPPAS